MPLRARHQPDYQEMGAHYGATVLPIRVRESPDKAKAEVRVQLVERVIPAALRKRTFFSLAELNQAIRGLLDRFNNRPVKKLPGSLLSMYESLDKPALKLLPAMAYCRILGQSGFTTLAEHMLRLHREYVKWIPERRTNWIHKIGEATAKLAEGIMSRRAHPLQGFRACLGLVTMAKKHGEARVDAACPRALAYGALSSKSVEHIIDKALDAALLLTPDPGSNPILHPSLRGAGYFLTA
ncbi:hypothetical protein DFAR_10019 [Desulfarculales bacterium]